MLAKALQGGTSAAKTYVDDVFSTYLYTGNGSTQTITNGIDLAGKGGLVWTKNRNGTQSNYLVDTVTGAQKELISNSTAAQVASAGGITAFSSSGYSTGTDGGYNGNADTYVSWTFRKAPKFFDVVTYTGNGSNRTITHSLGQIPGTIIVKRTDTTSDWQVYHRSLANTEYLVLNTTAAKATGTTRWNSTTPTATEFTVGTDASVNANTGTYVAYLFAHDTTADGLIQCGSYTGNGSTTGPTVTLGWEPQWVMIKSVTTGAGAGWGIYDNMRGIPNGVTDPLLLANSSGAESSIGQIDLLATGFVPTINNNNTNASGETYVYIAIRRPNKPPTSGTQVFQPTVYTGTNVDNRLVDTTIAPDMVWVRQRDDTVLGGMVVGDRLRGQPYMLTGTTAAEVNDANAFDQQLVSATEYGTAFSAMNGFWCGNDATAKLNANTTSNNHIAEAFKRAPGFFDVVIVTTNGQTAPITSAHNLGVAPEMMIAKKRGPSGGVGDWMVYHKELNGGVTPQNYRIRLNSTGAQGTGATVWNNTAPTATQFTIGTDSDVNSGTAGDTTAFWLFASLPGISKVGSYTGNGGTVNNNGTSQTINCGFSAGARFVLIKRTDSTGDWYVFDSARGIVAGNDPFLVPNSTAAEVTTVDAVDADNSGFIVNQTSGTNLNVTSATYIYLAIA